MEIVLGIAEGKHLYTLHEQTDTLNGSDVATQFCPKCDMSVKRPAKARLTVHCLEGPFQKV